MTGGKGNNSENENKGEDAEINRVSVRVPPFYPPKPMLWFSSLESQFVLSGITSETTKYHYAVSNLEPNYAEIVEDIIAAPQTPDKYERLKSELIKRLTASRERKVKQLLTHEELGDRKPSQFLRHLADLAGPGVPDSFLRTLWTSRLPNSVQTIIASQAKSTLEEVAELADQIMDVVTPSPQVAAASTSRHTAMGSDPIAKLTKQVEAMSARLDRMDRMSRSRQRSTSRRRGRSSTTRSQSNYRKFPICWYHSKFGDKAHKCVKPCDYSGKVRGSR